MPIQSIDQIPVPDAETRTAFVANAKKAWRAHHRVGSQRGRKPEANRIYSVIRELTQRRREWTQGQLIKAVREKLNNQVHEDTIRKYTRVWMRFQSLPPDEQRKLRLNISDARAAIPIVSKLIQQKREEFAATSNWKPSAQEGPIARRMREVYPSTLTKEYDHLKELQNYLLAFITSRRVEQFELLLREPE